MNTKRDLKVSIRNYRELQNLKEEILLINLCLLSNEELEDFELLKFKILEELIFTEMDIRNFKGISLDGIHEKLNTLYRKSIGDSHE